MNEMQVSVENIDNLTRQLNITVPLDELEQRKNQHLVELAKKTRLDGFRPGKVPISVIDKLYGDSLWQEVIEKSLQKSLAIALEKEALNPAGRPHIELINAEPGTNLIYTAKFEVYPQVEAPKLKGVSLERLKVTITETDIDKVIDKIRLQYAEWIEVSCKAAFGHQVTFDLVFSEPEKTRRDLRYVLEDGKIPDGFSVLLGSSAGETLTVSLPKEPGSNEFSAAMIEVKKVAEAKLPELDGSFAQRLGVIEGSVQALRMQIKEHMQIELDRVLREKEKDQVIEKLIDRYTVDELPQGILTQEFQRLEQDMQRQRKQQTGNEEEIVLTETEKTDLMLMARRRVMLGILFKVLIEKHHLQVDEIRVQQQIDKLASAFQFDHKVRDEIYKNKGMIENIRSSVLEEQVIDKLLEEAEYTEKVVEYATIMNLKEMN